MGHGIAPNSSHFTGKKKSKHKHIKVRKNKRVHKNKYAKCNQVTKESETVKDEKQTDIKESADKVIEYVSNKISAGNCAPAEEANMIQALAELISVRAQFNQLFYQLDFHLYTRIYLLP